MNWTDEGCLCGTKDMIEQQSKNTEDMSRPPRAKRLSVVVRASRFPFHNAAMPRIRAMIAVARTESTHMKSNLFNVYVLGPQHLMYNGQEK